MWFGADASVLLAALNVVLFAMTLAVWGVAHVRTGAPGRAAPAPTGTRHAAGHNLTPEA